MIWKSMISRCTKTTDKAYPRYGGRGITVCNRWLSFENFFADMGRKPPGLSLERKNNDGPYSPGNCRWATPAEQSRNTRRNIMVDYHGRRVRLIDIIDERGLPWGTIYQRIHTCGWSADRALDTPLKASTTA